MFDFGIGYTELFVVALVAIIVIGPKDLPRVLRGLGRMMAKMRGMAREFQGHLDQAMKEAGVDEIKKEVQSLKTMNPVTEVKNEIKKQDEDFKKYFGESAPKLPEPPAEAKPKAPAA